MPDRRAIQAPGQLDSRLPVSISSKSTSIANPSERDTQHHFSLGHTRTLDSHASRLRRELSGPHNDFVVNIWGVGYKLVT